MIKLVPFNSNLISIGNERHYDGQPVYTDGRVAYGWHFVPQATTPAPAKSFGGFWVGVDSGYSYQLARKDMELGNRIGSHSHGDVQAFPCYATIELNGGYLPEYGDMFTSNGMYNYDGAIVSIDGSGKLLAYDDYELHVYQPGSQRRDSHGYAMYFGNVDVIDDNQHVLKNARYYTIHNDDRYVYDDEFELLAQYVGNELTVYNDDGTVYYTGTGSVEISGKMIAVLTFTKTDVPLDILNYSSIAHDNYISHLQDDNGYDIYEGHVSISYDTTHETYNYYSTGNGYTYVYTDSYSLKAEYHDDEIKVYDEYGGVDYTGTGNVTISGTGQPVMVEKQYAIGQHERSIDIRKIFQLATTENCYLKVDTPDRDNEGNIIYNGNFKVEYEMIVAIGTAQTIAVQSGNVSLYDNNGNLIARNSDDRIYIVVNGTETYAGKGAILYDDDSTAGGYDYEIRLYVDGRSGLCYMEYDEDNNIIITDRLTGMYIATEDSDMLNMFWDGVMVWTGMGYITTRNDTAVEWLCDYTIRRDITGYSNNIKDPQGNVEITSANFHAVQNGDTVTIEEYGVQTYDGPGWIETDNLVIVTTEPEVWRGDYTIRRDITGQGIKVPGTNGFAIYDKDDRSKIIADVSGTTVNVYDSTGQITWTGTGEIITTNLVPCKWLCTYETHAGVSGTGKIIHKAEDDEVNTYIWQTIDDQEELIANEDGNDVVVVSQQYDGPGIIVTSNEVMMHSVKTYEITEDGCEQKNYPATWSAGDDVKVKLNDGMALEIETEQGTATYSQDPLALLHTKSFVYPAGVHAWKDYVISQDGKLMWRSVQQQVKTKNYDGIEKCFNLSWLIKKW